MILLLELNWFGQNIQVENNKALMIKFWISFYFFALLSLLLLHICKDVLLLIL
jgi:hypothetical protein